MTSVGREELLSLMGYFLKNTYYAPEEDETGKEILENCIQLMQRDYTTVSIPNPKGELSTHYPSQILILENELVHIGNREPGTIYESQYDLNSLRSQIQKARKARCRARFPVPVILYKGKNICRSATIACTAEVYGRAGLDYFMNKTQKEEEELYEEMDTNESENPKDWHLFNSVRNHDINLLKRFNVDTIVDLMVENKKVKYGLYVTSSEKVDKEQRYSEFNIVNFPYPGCEFFKNFRDHSRGAEGLMFDWSQKYVDTTLFLPEEMSKMSKDLKIDWTKYKEWDLIKLTQNYMTFLLNFIQGSSSGVLIHCISGWDRTPLFISLLRILLWAQGLIHQSLDEHQILYLTIAYDWMAFGHNLHDRIAKGEEIFFFCFYVLKFLSREEDLFNSRHSKLSRATEKLVSRNSSSSDSDKVINNVIRADSDTQLELLLEEGSVGSDVSLNSVGSSISTKSQEPPLGSAPQDCISNNDETNGNAIDVAVNADSLQNLKTSPVSVPSPKKRQRQDSSSSGSWQVVTGTGSLRGSGSENASQDLDELLRNNSESPLNYSTRVRLVREEFFKIFYKSANISYSEPSGIIQLFGNIAEKVGF